MRCPVCNSFQRAPNGWRKADITPRDLSLSAKGCNCCCIILQGCHGLFGRLGLAEENLSKFDLWFAFDHTEGAHDTDFLKLITVHFKYGKSLGIEFFAVEGNEDEYIQVAQAWDDMTVGKRVSTDTSSNQAFETAKSWIYECATEHEYCPEEMENRLPTRVVDVGLNSGKIMLKETNGQYGRYIALSHCWGKAQIIKTTQATFEERKLGISPSQLSRTFNDAIELTRRLGIPYIWIDSLCIIQDSRSDWAKEASKMASFYKNAMLTIAATKSSSGDGGLYTSNPDFELKGMTPDGEQYHLVFRERIEHELMDSKYGNMIELFPLMSRAWILQERLLSERVLHFGPYEIFFECNTSIECECGEIAGFEISAALPKMMHSEALDNADNLYYGQRAWHALVGLYTGLSITVPSDKLPAFGGLARQWSVAKKSKYLAGLWEDTLIEDLLWQSNPIGARPAWRAPTWSWASVDHPIYYRDGSLYWQETQPDEERLPYEHLVKVVDCTCIPKDIDEFGELQSGFLRIRGRCAEGILQYGTSNSVGLDTNRKRNNFKNGFSYAVHIADGKPYEIIPDFAFEVEGESFIPAGTAVICLLIGIVSYESANRHHPKPRLVKDLSCLVLIPSVREPACFERIAMFLCTEQDGDNIDDGFTLYANEEKELTLV
ncbi:HET-domain-containing protein [Delitschia confertaspora ATCC 74209]|uniref:HET-domain-containing protein n=1 Tax=Delitschia confertaspora ATCC 74209 TaxID=1513339 RepID=A0A9P4MRA8_9PLEO|nr:HET-domain-containing protein [Delitschia confertaspora ATCC 74209]